uniref:Thyroglobulin type-1 domain-containing protein n=1 Tax=Timema douglasi TaxID=61478 RepID=A0A7R8VNI3_TIMDO|nr:unnamed protein product [Timema douglasi]
MSVLQESIPTIIGSLAGFGDDTLDSKDEPEANDCLSDRQAVQEELLAGNTELYVPECTPDGRFQKTQCYKSTGECVTQWHLCGGRVKINFGNTTLSTPDRNSNLDLPIIGSIDYCKSSALDYADTEAGYCWCVQEDGKPIPGTSIKNKDPNCDSVPTPSRPMPGASNNHNNNKHNNHNHHRGSCPEAKKIAFLEELMSFMTKKMQAATNKSATTERFG